MVVPLSLDGELRSSSRTGKVEMEERSAVATYEMPIPSKGSAARFYTERFTYKVQSVLTTRPIAIDGVDEKVLRASINLRIFKEDQVTDEQALLAFFGMSSGLDDTTHELLNGRYRSHNRDLRIKAGELPEGDFRHRMPLYVLDPGRKSGSVKFSQHLTMLELIRALTGGERFDRITRYGWPDTQGQRVGRRMDGDITAAAVSYTGYVLVTVPSEPVIDLEAGTASFHRPQDIGQAIYLPMSLVSFAVNLYFKALEPRWRELISKEHELIEQQSRSRRLLLAEGREAEKPQTPGKNPTDKKKRRPRNKGSASPESRQPEGQIEGEHPEINPDPAA